MVYPGVVRLAAANKKVTMARIWKVMIDYTSKVSSTHTHLHQEYASSVPTPSASPPAHVLTDKEKQARLDHLYLKMELGMVPSPPEWYSLMTARTLLTQDGLMLSLLDVKGGAFAKSMFTGSVFSLNLPDGRSD